MRLIEGIVIGYIMEANTLKVTYTMIDSNMLIFMC